MPAGTGEQPGAHPAVADDIAGREARSGDLGLYPRALGPIGDGNLAARHPERARDPAEAEHVPGHERDL